MDLYAHYNNIIQDVPGKKSLDEIFSFALELKNSNKVSKDSLDRNLLFHITNTLIIPGIFDGVPSIDARGSTVFNQIYAMFNYYLSGKKYFAFKPDLQMLLANTEFKKIDVSFIQSPFHTICLEFSPEISKYLETEKSAEIKGVYVILHTEKDYTTDYVELIDGKKPHRILSIVTYGDFKGLSPKADCAYIRLSLPEHGDIFKILSDAQRIYRANTFGADFPLYNKLIPLIINMLFYIIQNPNDIEELIPKQKDLSKIKNKKKLRKATRTDNNTQYYVGKKIIIDPSLKHKDNFEGGSSIVFTGQWMVRGHWRLQAMGKGYSQHKLIWIHPYKKGDTLGDLINKEYIVR